MPNSRSSLANPGADSSHRRRNRDSQAAPPPPAADLPAEEFAGDAAWNADDALRREMQRLEANRQFLVASSAAPPAVDPFAVASPALSDLDPLAAIDSRLLRPQTPVNGFATSPFAGHAFPGAARGNDEVEKLKVENEELHKLVEEMKQIFAQASEQEAENVKTIETLRPHVEQLELAVKDKDEQIEMLTGQIHELEQHIQQVVPPAPPPSEDELSKMADELEKERCQLAQDRKTIETERQQLRNDEEDMMRQMREMEVQMARERAEMARQRTELQRLHSEVKHELELLQGNDRVLTERLAQFQRRHHDLLHRAGMAPAPAAPQPTAPAAADNQAGKRESNVFSRLFGRK